MMQRNWVEQMPSVEAFWINRVLYDVQHKPAEAAAFRNDPDAYLRDLPLTASVKQLLRVNDIGELYLAGANPYLLRTHCLQLQVPEPEYLAALRAVSDRAYGDE
jgi:Aromatic-ring-opening dioxygenase LigAB, LigA subunit